MHCIQKAYLILDLKGNVKVNSNLRSQPLNVVLVCSHSSSFVKFKNTECKHRNTGITSSNPKMSASALKNHFLRQEERKEQTNPKLELKD